MKAEEKAQELYPNNSTFCGGVAQIARDAFAKGARMQKEVDDKELSEKVSAAYQLGLSTLESEKPMREGLNEEISRYLREECSDDDEPGIHEIAEHFAEWGYLRAAEKYNEIEYNRQRAEESVPKDLDKAARKASLAPLNFELNEEYLYEYPYLPIAEQKFKEGAKWQREQMMKEAVEADVNIYKDLAAGKSWAEFVAEMPTNNLGDKVRIIIVKENEK